MTNSNPYDLPEDLVRELEALAGRIFQGASPEFPASEVRRKVFYAMWEQGWIRGMRRAFEILNAEGHRKAAKSLDDFLFATAVAIEGETQPND
jgi:hypothetical protein